MPLQQQKRVVEQWGGFPPEPRVSPTVLQRPTPRRGDVGQRSAVRARLIGAQPVHDDVLHQAVHPRHARLIGVHFLPNAAQAVIVSLTLAVARGILLESALSFFGVGVRPPQASWGNMLYQAQSTLATEPWLAFAPGLFILMTALSVNLVGDRVSRQA